MWLPFRKRKKEREMLRCAKLVKAEKKADQIKERGTEVAQNLEARLFRDVWGEAVRDIIRREEQNNARRRHA